MQEPIMMIDALTPDPIAIQPGARFIVFSDCHRGDGSAGDEFARNSLIFKCALEYYLQNGYTLIELGDAEELWENSSFEQIYITHTSVYELLGRFHDPDPAKTRYLKVWGNHDEDWRDNPASLEAIFPGIRLHEALELALELALEGGTGESPGAGGFSRTLLLHGHQADPLCSGLRARLSRFLVRNVWSGLQRFGIGDPTRAAENPGVCDSIDEALYRAAKRRRGVVIAGHTHRPVFANLSLTERRYLESGIGTPGVRRKEGTDPIYFNAGSCVHPRCITGLEITVQESGQRFTLIKWGYQAALTTPNPPYSLSILRTVLQ